MSVGKRIRAAREAAGMTQAEVARELDVTESSVRLYELEKRNPKPEMLERIAEVLEVDVQSLKEIEIQSARDALEVLFRLEDACGLEPREDGTLGIDPESEGALRLRLAIEKWAQMRARLDAGEISREEYNAWRSRAR